MGQATQWVPRLKIPAIDLDMPLTRFYLDGVSWAVPLWTEQVGHLEGTAWPPDGGNVVLAGHAEYPNRAPGVFARLPELQTGDRVVLLFWGQHYHYEVHEVLTVAFDDLSVLYPAESPILTLMTCDTATYNPSLLDYDRRVIVRAVRVKDGSGS